MKRLLSTLIIYEMLMLAAAQAASAQSGADTPNHNPRGCLVERYGVTQELYDLVFAPLIEYYEENVPGFSLPDVD